jgi:hypothetical protein
MLNLELPVIHASRAGMHYSVSAIAAANAGGQGEFSPRWCGQSASGCREIRTAQFESFYR